MAATATSIRPLTLAAVDAVLAFAAADEAAFRGRPSRLQRTDLLDWWSRSELARDSWLYEDAGVPAAVGWFHLWGDIGTCIGIVAQGAKGRGFGAALLERAEACARERGAARAHAEACEEDTAAAALFRSRGFSEVRRFYEMAIELDAAPPPPSLPAGLVVDEFREADAPAFHAGATKLYESVGMEVESAVVVFEKALA
jgi:mycothiol synthase